MLRVLRLLTLVMLAAIALASRAEADDKRRVALVLGNAKYENWASLRNPVRDAELIVKRLRTLGFDTVETLQDGEYDATRAKLKDFEAVAMGADLVVIYYTGHGAQFGEKAYIIPSDASPAYNLTAGVADSHAVAVDNLIGLANLGKAGVVLIDACRENVGHDSPPGVGGAKGPALIGMQINRALIGERVLVQMSTQSSAQAYDGDGEHSLYAMSIDDRFDKEPHSHMPILLKEVEDQVYDASDHKQKPALLDHEMARDLWVTLTLDPRPMNIPTPPSPQELARQADESDWKFARRQNKREGYETYLQNPIGQHRQEAMTAIAALEAQEKAQLTGTADEGRRALAMISELEWRTLTPEVLLDRVVNATTADAMRLLSDQNVQRATIILAAMYDDGLGGLDRNPAQALILYRRASDAGNATAQRVMAEFARFGRDGEAPRLDKAAELYDAAALGGDALAQDRLGSMYADGLRGEKLRNKAIEYFQMAADQNYAWGLCHIGAAYGEGALGLKRDDKKAADYAEKSATLGNYCGEMSLGHMYLFGEHGLTADPKRGAELYEAAARQGAPSAQTSIGILYQTGQGVRRDMTKAVAYFNKAAEQKYPEALFLLGVIYANADTGVPRDLKLAIKYFQDAAAQQFHPAEAALGWAYSEGLGGLAYNPDEAARLFKKSADGQDPEGLYRLGYATFEGKGVPKNPVEAKRLMRASAALGFNAAKRWLNGQGG